MTRLALPGRSTLTTTFDLDSEIVYWSTWPGESYFDCASTFTLIRESRRDGRIPGWVCERCRITKFEFDAARDAVEDYDLRRGRHW